MRYPTGIAGQILWGVTLLVCAGLAATYEGNGLVMDWLIITVVAYWQLRSRAKNPM
jgi:hypothetical protein